MRYLYISQIAQQSIFLLLLLFTDISLTHQQLIVKCQTLSYLMLGETNNISSSFELKT
jgi:hypothetical protein